MVTYLWYRVEPEGANTASYVPAPVASVERPAPGLGRGRFEAPKSVFLIAPLLALLIAAIYIALRLRAENRDRNGRP